MQECTHLMDEIFCLFSCDLALRACCVSGKDATEDFDEIGHSKSARELLANYKIGAYAVRSLCSLFVPSTCTETGGSSHILVLGEIWSSM